MKKRWWKQTRAVVGLEMRKTFLSRRGLWIYLLAFAPVALFFVHSLVDIRLRGVRHELAATGPSIQEQDFASIQPGMSHEDVVRRLGPPRSTVNRQTRRRTSPHSFEVLDMETLSYNDSDSDYRVYLVDGKVSGSQAIRTTTLGEVNYVFAGVFEFFFIRLAIFFGCLGIFINLFRGEMMGKSLHYYLLTPIRREALVAGKYLAGLLAAAVIFTVSVALQMLAISLEFDAGTIQHFLSQGHGLSQIGAYLGVTVLACVGYGSIFLAAGLFFRNPIVPAAIVLVWESINPVLPALLKKFSVIYYLKSLCPLGIPVDPGMPPLMTMLVSNADPISGYLAVFGLLGVAAIFLVFSAANARKLEINYTTE